METSDEVSPVRAAVVGDKNKVMDWLKQRRHDSVADRNTSSAIIIQAANYGHTDICQLIINTGAVVDKRMLAVALECACKLGHLSTAQLLIQHCDSSNTQCFQTALGAACSAGELEVVFWLMDVMKLSTADTIKWLLMTASGRGDINKVRQLVRREALYTANVVSDGLRVACDWGRTNVVDWLMTHTSADANKCGIVYMDVEGDVTSLYAACRNIRSRIIPILLSSVTPHTVNMQCTNIRNSALGLVISYSDPTLYICCVKGDIDEVNKRLYTCNVDDQDDTGDTILHQACVYGLVDIVRLMLSVFARIDITDDQGVTPIEQARRRDYMNIVDLLEKPMLATTCATNSSNSTHVTSISTNVTSISTNAHMTNVTPVVVSSATIHSVLYHHPDNTKPSGTSA